MIESSSSSLSSTSSSSRNFLASFIFTCFLMTEIVSASKITNRTSCFHYLSCLEVSQTTLKQCVGGTAIALSLESKDVNIRDLIKYRALEFVGCQDRLLKEIVDFEALQILVGDDARECFEKLPESTKRVEEFGDACDYVEPLARNSSTKGDSLQCLIEYKQDREYCESLLECCPDHTRCGERMNAVSLSYQNARVKAEQIVYNMISCIVSNDPRFLREGARLQSLRDPYRNAGVPFLRPDAYTEARITRRLALTSTSTLAQRKERFLKKYAQVRQIVAEKLVNHQHTTTETTPSPSTTTTTSEALSIEDVVSETSDQTDKNERNENISDERIQTVRQLIRTASDKDLTKYVSLISEGKFSKLFEIANVEKKLHQLTKSGTNSNILKASEGGETNHQPKSVVVRSSMKTDDEPLPTIFTITDSMNETKSMGEGHLAPTIIDRTSMNDPGSTASINAEAEMADDKNVESVEEPEAKELLDKNRALLVETEIKDLAEESKKLEEAKLEETSLIAEEPSTFSPIPTGEESREDEVDGSGEEVTEPSTTTTTTTSEPIIAQVKMIRPRVEQSYCQQYAGCWQTIIDYEQQCDRKYSTEVLSHGIDDAEVLTILYNSSISHHEIVLKACLRPLDKTVHSTLNQLLIIQRGVRKACLDLGRNKIAVTDEEQAACNVNVPTTASIDEFLASEHVRSQANHLTCRAKLEPIREMCSVVRNCCASVETCDNYIASSPVKKLETEAVRRLVKRQNDCETKMLQTLSYIHEQLSSPSRRRRFYFH